MRVARVACSHSKAQTRSTRARAWPEALARRRDAGADARANANAVERVVRIDARSYVWTDVAREELPNSAAL